MDYSYIREAFNIDHSNNYVLSIQLDPDGFSFYVNEKESILKPLYFTYKRFDKPGIADLIRELKDFQYFDKYVFYKTIIIYHTKKFCIIPDELYNPDYDINFLRMNHSIPDEATIHSTDIQEINAKVLFSIPEELNRLINIKFPNAVLLHSACPVLNFGIRKYEKSCIAYQFGSSISVAVFDKRVLKLFNVFSVHNESDVVYYIINALHSCNLTVAETTFYLSGVKKEYPEENTLLSEYISNPANYHPEFKELNVSDYPVNMMFNHLEALYCVL